MDPKDLQTAVDAYIACALWSSTDESRPDGGDPLDANYSEDDIAPDSLERMRADVQKFLEENRTTIGRCLGFMRPGSGRQITWASIGHDLWLNRNGHGCGFWDGDYPEPEATTLNEAAERMGEAYLSVSDGVISLYT